MRKVVPNEVDALGNGLESDDLLACHPAGAICDRSQRTVWISFVLRPLHRPVTKKQTHVNQRIANRTHLPVEHRYDARGIVFVEHDVVELEVVVNNRGVATGVRGNSIH